MSGNTANLQKTPVEAFRDALIEQLRRELTGPDPQPGETVEILDESPRQRYSAGILFPSQLINRETEDDGIPESSDNDGDDTTAGPGVDIPETASSISSRAGLEDMDSGHDDTITMANSYMPSAMGISFLCDDTTGGLTVIPEAAVYDTGKRKDGDREFTIWQRRPLELLKVGIPLDMPAGLDVTVADHSIAENLNVRAVVRARRNGSRLVTVSLYNTKKSSGSSITSASDCFFQTGFRVVAADGSAVFRPYQELATPSGDPEEQGLRLLFRQRLAFGVGHGCAVDWGDVEEGKAGHVRTDSLPFLKIPPVEPRQAGGDELSMTALAGGAGGDQEALVPDILEQLTGDYDDWIAGITTHSEALPDDLREAASRHIADCRTACQRMRDGIRVLRDDDTALRAFCLANRAMLMQQYHSRRKTRSAGDDWEEITADYTPRESWMGRWRTFQIAFILMNLPSVTPRKDGSFPSDRDLVDLIWFPTGGGKTEAYLGLAAYTIFLRRLLNPANGGCTVLMRYTLRLLTSQQFQRAGALICACETLRLENPDELGGERISIGLWVGQSLTPNTRQEALQNLNGLVSKPESTENKFQLLKCPWCGTRLDETRPRGYQATGSSPKTVHFVCPEKRCSFSSRKTPLPVLVVDEDIYDTPPTLLIGTVDKFAMLAWRDQAGRLFGTGRAVSPPDLIIQDELHLISGPLGTMVGLFEGVIDLLCSRNGRKPKIVGSTATIRRAPEQCRALYNRATFQFPPPGIDISDSWFAAENPAAPGRIYTGVFPTGSPSFVTALVRTAGGLLQGCRTLDPPAGGEESVRDPYWTLVQYFNSLRELGRALTLLQADIPEYMWVIASRSHIPREKVRTLYRMEELTSRRTAQQIPEILEDLGVSYPPEDGSRRRPMDALLATNMISVGVDVDRLGLMCIVGQPKTTSEYIQASSRVGRSKDAPGLVITMYNPGKPRDRSHFEQFRTYHSSLYRYVEPTSVTPYSIPVLERALHSVLVIIGRHLSRWSSPDQVDFDTPPANDAVAFLRERCGDIDPEHLGVFTDRVNALVSHWQTDDFDDWGSFAQPDPDQVPLMYPAGTLPLPEWQDAPWPTPSSMRSVDSESEADVIHVYPA